MIDYAAFRETAKKYLARGIIKVLPIVKKRGGYPKTYTDAQNLQLKVLRKQRFAAARAWKDTTELDRQIAAIVKEARA